MTLPDGRSSAVAAVRDALLAIVCYAAGYLIRFPEAGVHAIGHDAVAWLPLLAGAQIAGLALTGRYTRPSAARTIAGVLLGTLAGTVAGWLLVGHAGVSRLALACDAVLFTLAALSTLPFERTPPSDMVSPTAAGAGGGMLAFRDRLSAIYAYRELIKNLVLKDLKLKYRGSVFGFLWSLVNPLVMILVYLVVFKYIMAIRSGGFVFLLLVGILAWTFFASSATMGAGAIVDNAGLLKTVYFPRAVLPIASVFFNLAQYLLTTAVFLPVLLAFHHAAPAPPVLLFPVFLLLQLAMTIGVALALAAGTAFFRDIRHLLDIALMVMFWTTPILYDYHTVPAAWRLPILLSPLSPFVLAYQDIFYYAKWPDPAAAAVAVVYAAVALAGGFALFMRVQGQFTEQL
jgi:lipopolysaccharide transport system permease protein